MVSMATDFGCLLEAARGCVRILPGLIFDLNQGEQADGAGPDQPGA
jgi:hypothetical protein